MNHDIEKQLSETFLAASARVGAVWTEAMGEWFRSKSPSDQISMLMVTDMVDAAWKAAGSTPASFPQFVEEIRRWEQVHFQAILNYGRANL